MVKMCCAVTGIFSLLGVVGCILTKVKGSPADARKNTEVMAVCNWLQKETGNSRSS